jgi:hypothetical protein
MIDSMTITITCRSCDIKTSIKMAGWQLSEPDDWFGFIKDLKKVGWQRHFDAQKGGLLNLCPMCAIPERKPI